MPLVPHKVAAFLPMVSVATGSLQKVAFARIAIMARCRSITLHHARPAPMDKFVATPLAPDRVAVFLPTVSASRGHIFISK
jgi:hypothetical protein